MYVWYTHFYIKINFKYRRIETSASTPTPIPLLTIKTQRRNNFNDGKHAQHRPSLCTRVDKGVRFTDIICDWPTKKIRISFVIDATGILTKI